MSKKNAFLLLALAFICITCKKGDNDPAISLRTRKARLTGEWRMTKGKVAVTTTETNGMTYNDTYTFEGSNMTVNITETGANLIVLKGTYVLSLTFEGNGSFSVEETLGGSVLRATGHWDFCNGVGEDKKKENVILVIDKVSSGRTTEHLFNRGRTEVIYKLRELRNKTLVIESAARIVVDAKSNGDNTGYLSEYTLIQ